MEDVRIREANLSVPEDQHAILALLDHYARDEMGGGTALADEVKARLIEGLQAHPTTVILLCFVGEDAAGIAVCFVGFSTFAASKLLNVHDLAVNERFRGQGLGRRLLEGIEHAARQRDCCKITLEVRSDNHRAQQLYQSQGFTGCGPELAPSSMWYLQKPLK